MSGHGNCHGPYYPTVYPTEEQIQYYLQMAGGSRLHQAVLLGDVEQTRRLLAAGHDPNDSSGNRGLTPLFYACGFCGVGLSDGDYAGCVAELIRAGAEVNVVCEFDFDIAILFSE